MKNGSLYDFIKKVHVGTCKWNSTDKMIILIGIAFGMDYLRNHEIMRRDLKLQNVLLDDDMTPKICDFAESKNFQIELDNGQVEIVGTPLFMAPEIKNGSHYSFPIDVYSFGIIAYYIYTDQFPDESRPVDLNKLDPKFRKFVSSMIDEFPEKRPTFETITKMYLNNFEETWIDGADIEKVEIYLHQLGFTLKPREHHLDLEVIHSITPEVYPENAREPIIDIDEIMNNPDIPENLSVTLINASVMLQCGGADYAEDINEARSILQKAGYIFFMGITIKEGELIKPDPFYAIHFLRESSLLKSRDSMCMLSQIFAESGNKECQKIAFKVACMSADLGCPESERALGKFYLNGIGTEKNVIMSALYIKLAADKGDSESMYLLANTLITNTIFTRLVPDQEQNEIQTKELKFQIEKAQQIVDEMKGMSYKFFKEFLLTKDAISNSVVTAFVAKRYYANAARKGVEKAKEALLDFEKNDAEIQLNHNMPDFVGDIQASFSVSPEDF